MAGGAAGAGTVMGATGALLQGNSTKNALDYNATVQENYATGAVIAAKLNADKQSLMSNKVIGSAKAGYGASGVTSDSGSVFSVLASSAASAEEDRQNIIYGGQVRATNYENQAALDKTSAKNALTGSYFSALSSIFSGGAKMYGNSISPGAGGTPAADAV